jgi:hypothetical protein
LLLLYKPLHLEAQQVSTRIEVRRHHIPLRVIIITKEGSKAAKTLRQLREKELIK